MEVPVSSSFSDLRVCQEAMILVKEIYRATVSFPRYELYGLTQQMRRAAVSVPSNIAEGKGHCTDREFSSFLFHTRGSPLELQTQVMTAQDLEYWKKEEAQQLLASAEKVGRSLAGLIDSLRSQVA
jgi:four helix bundle protein